MIPRVEPLPRMGPRESLLAACLCLLLYAALAAPMLSLLPGPDAGLFLYIGQGILQGEVPYRDAWDHKPPLVHFTFALGLLITAGRNWGPWLLEVLAVSGAGWLSYRTLRAVHGSAVAGTVTLLWMLSLAELGSGGGLTELFTLPLQFGAIWMLLRWRREPYRAAWPFLLGVLTGLAFLYRQNHIMTFGVVFLMGTLLAGGWKGAGLLLRSLALAAVGAALVCLPFVVYFLLHDAWDEMWDATFVYNFLYTTVPFTRRIDTFGFGIERIVWSYGALLVWTIALGRLIAGKGLPAGDRGILLGLGLLALPLEFYAAAASGKHYEHYFIVCLPVLALLLAQLLAVVWSRRRIPGARGMSARVAALLLFLAALFATRFEDLEGRYRQVGQRQDSSSDRAAIAYLENHTAPVEKSLVWGYDPRILALGHRRSPTRFFYQYPLITRGYHQDALAAEFVAELKAHPPVLIFDTGHLLFPPLDPARREMHSLPTFYEAQRYGPPSARISSFFEMVDRDYELVERIEDIDVYALRR